MPTNLQVSTVDICPELCQLSKTCDAMQLAQLTAFAFAIPQLYLCREYLLFDEQQAITACLQRLQKGLSATTFSIDDLKALLAEGDFFDSEEARLRLAPS